MNGWQNKWPAPAKVNLMLRITGRKDDGYHLLQTVFQLTDWCDWLTFESLSADKVCLVDSMPGVPDASNLVVRAALALKEFSNERRGVAIHLEKNLPMGGGLGGGSSNAATTLVVLNHLWGLGLSTHQLMQVGVKLGADVPVFIFGHAAWAEGVGEQLQSIQIPEKWLVIVKPDCHVDTGEIFSQKELTRNSKSITIADFIEGQHQNDCTDVVRKLYQPVDQALLDLSQYAESRLTGTGACVFAEFDQKQEAMHVCDRLSDRWQVYVAKGMNRSLLLDLLI